MNNLTNDETSWNSWVSLADILWQPKGSNKPKVTVALLKKIIDAKGIWVRVENGQLIAATVDDEKEFASKARAYKLLDEYCSELMACHDLPPGVHPNQDPYRWLGAGSPLIEFGWPEDEAPDFADWIVKFQYSKNLLSSVTEPPISEAEDCKNKKHDMTRERGSRRLILEYWDKIKQLHGDNANGRQVLNVLRIHIDKKTNNCPS